VLWPEAGDSLARRSLRQALFALRTSLGPARSGLRIDDDAVSLHSGALDIDVHAFERRLAKGTPEALAEAAALYRGDFLAGLGVEFNGSLWQHTGLATVLLPFSNNQPGTIPPGLIESHWSAWNGRRLGLNQDGQGTRGPPGPQGPQGPAGNPNIFPSSQIFTLPNTGVVTITDPNVRPASLIVLQYVGGRGGESDLVVDTVGTGHFTARGGKGRQFRYVVFN